MITKRIKETASFELSRAATEYLTKAPIGELSSSDIILMISEGFEVADVQAMISQSNLFSSPQIAARILGKGSTSRRRKREPGDPFRLDARHSAVALQYAKGLDHAKAVFGTQLHAEEWLSRPCKYLAGMVPVDLLDNAVGFQAVKDYLERVERGVYQ